MTITHDAIQALMEGQVDAYQAALYRIAQLSLVDVFLLTREHFPTAVKLHVDTTDQDMSGSLVTNSEDAFDAAGEMLDDIAPDTSFDDDVWGPLSNLDDRTETIWGQFIIETDTGARYTVRHLDLLAIEAAIPQLMNPDDDPSGETCPECGCEVDRDDVGDWNHVLRDESGIRVGVTLYHVCPCCGEMGYDDPKDCSSCADQNHDHTND